MNDKELLDTYKGLSPQQQKATDETIKAFKETEKEQKDK